MSHGLVLDDLSDKELVELHYALKRGVKLARFNIVRPVIALLNDHRLSARAILNLRTGQLIRGHWSRDDYQLRTHRRPDMDDAKRTEIRDMLFEGANAYSELEDLLVKAGDAIVEGADPERVVDALEQVIVAHRECSRGLFVTLTQLDSPLRTELAQSLGEIAFNAYTEARANRNHDGSKTPPWEELGAVQEGWEACARTLFAMGVAAASEAGPLAVLCTCGRDAGERFYSAHESNPDGHAVGCPKWGPKK